MQDSQVLRARQDLYSSISIQLSLTRGLYRSIRSSSLILIIIDKGLFRSTQDPRSACRLPYVLERFRQCVLGSGEPMAIPRDGRPRHPEYFGVWQSHKRGAAARRYANAYAAAFPERV